MLLGITQLVKLVDPATDISSSLCDPHIICTYTSIICVRIHGCLMLTRLISWFSNQREMSQRRYEQTFGSNTKNLFLSFLKCRTRGRKFKIQLIIEVCSTNFPRSQKQVPLEFSQFSNFTANGIYNDGIPDFGIKKNMLLWYSMYCVLYTNTH